MSAMNKGHNPLSVPAPAITLPPGFPIALVIGASARGDADVHHAFLEAHIDVELHPYTLRLVALGILKMLVTEIDDGGENPTSGDFDAKSVATILSVLLKQSLPSGTMHRLAKCCEPEGGAA